MRGGACDPPLGELLVCEVLLEGDLLAGTDGVVCRPFDDPGASSELLAVGLGGAVH